MFFDTSWLLDVLQFILVLLILSTFAYEFPFPYYCTELECSVSPQNRFWDFDTKESAGDDDHNIHIIPWKDDKQPLKNPFLKSLPFVSLGTTAQGIAMELLLRRLMCWERNSIATRCGSCPQTLQKWLEKRFFFFKEICTPLWLEFPADSCDVKFSKSILSWDPCPLGWSLIHLGAYNGNAKEPSRSKWKSVVRNTAWQAATTPGALNYWHVHFSDLCRGG